MSFSWLQGPLKVSVYLPSLGIMFLTMKASQAPGVNTSLHGWRMRRAEPSLGCQRCSALASLLRMGGYRGMDGHGVRQGVPAIHLSQRCGVSGDRKGVFMMFRVLGRKEQTL